MLKKNIERYSRKNNYKSKYTEAQLLAALQVVDDGNMSIRKAAKRYGVPFTTIRDRVAGKTTSKVGRPPVLTEDEEAIISEISSFWRMGISPDNQGSHLTDQELPGQQRRDDKVSFSLNPNFSLYLKQTVFKRLICKSR